MAKANNKLASIYLLKIKDTYYVGSSVNTQSRFSRHFNSLKANNHHNPGLQNAYNKHQTLECFILEFGSFLNKSNIINREQFWYDQLKHKIKLVNSSVFVACPAYGRKPSPVKDKETWKMKISSSLLALEQRGSKNPFWGKKHTDESIKKMSSKKMGKSASFETKQKMSKAHLGKKMPEQSVLKAVQTRKNSGKYQQRGYFVRICPTSGEEIKRYDSIKTLESDNIPKTGVYKAIRNNTIYKNSKWRKEPKL